MLTRETPNRGADDLPPKRPGHGTAVLGHISGYLETYFWLIFKNVIGWAFILGSPVLGIALPGPGGIPLFLIGFALVTFPGKRKLTSRVMRGRQLQLQAQLFTFLTAIVSILGTAAVMWLIGGRYEKLLAYFRLNPTGNERTTVAVIVALVGVGLVTLGVTWLTTRLGLRVVNFILRRVPRIRRFVRPWLSKYGIYLLPSRRKRTADSIDGDGGGTSGDGMIRNDEILEFSEQNQTRVRNAWVMLKPWLRRAISVAITAYIFKQMITPLVNRWADVRDRVAEISILQFLLASMLFASFLFVFRAIAWRRILKAFGHKLPLAAATRIWSTSELARYLPGAIWQVVGRVYLVRPYGVSGSVCSTTQILELCIFLFANVLVGAGCLLYFGAKNLNAEARPYVYLAMAVLPAIGFLLHPKVFYGLVNRILIKIGKPSIVQRLRGKKLIGLLIWTILGLFVQSVGVYLISQPALGLKRDWFWMIAGAYSLAWCAGFLAFWAPGGIGVRELVFVAMMEAFLPADQLAGKLQDKAVRAATLIFVGFVLRIWTVIGELILTSLAYTLDMRGALGRQDAPGRLQLTPAPPVDDAAVGNS